MKRMEIEKKAKKEVKKQATDNEEQEFIKYFES